MKKKILTATFLTLLLCIFMCTPLFAAEQDSAGNIFEAADQVSLSDIPFFGAFAVGQNVMVDQADAKGSVGVMGTEVSVDGSSINETLYAGGGNVTVHNAAIKGNAYLMGNNVSLSGTSSCNGAYIMGSDILYEGTSNGLSAAGQSVTIKGTINGDAQIRAEKVEIDPAAVITGTLKISSEEEPSIPETAQIGSYAYSQVEKKEDASAGRKSIFASKVVRRIFWIAAMAVLGLVICWLFSDHLTSAGEYLTEKPGAYIGKGIAAFFLLPILSILLCCTLILAPAGGIMLILYGVLLFAAAAFTGASLGRLFLPNLNVFLSALIGVVLLQILKLIPFIGWIVGAACAVYILSYTVQYILENRLKRNKQA